MQTAKFTGKYFYVTLFFVSNNGLDAKYLINTILLDIASLRNKA